MKKIFALIIIISCHVLGQQRIDTLFSIRDLDGHIMFYYADKTFQIANTGTGIIVGDGYGFEGKYLYAKGYLSFDLSQIMTDTFQYKLSKAILSVVQTQSFGDGVKGRFPNFDNATKKTFCIYDHIVYGDVLDTNAWFAGDTSNVNTLGINIGVASMSADTGRKETLITPSILDDLQNGRKYSQYRIRFEHLYDTDSLSDYLLFGTGETKYFKPFIVLTWNKIVNVAIRNNGNNTIEIPSVISTYPNPFNNELKIRIEIKKKDMYRLDLYDVLGRKIKEIFNNEFDPGINEYKINLASQSSGNYFLILSSDHSKKQTIKITLTK